MKRLILLACIFFSDIASAQFNGKIIIHVVNDNKPIENATVELKRSKDSVIAKIALTDKTGMAEFENLSFGNYYVTVSAVGFHSKNSDAMMITESTPRISLPSLILNVKNASELQNVTVSTSKPFIQKLSDRIVVNVESSMVNAGSTALDILERSPGVTVDQNDAISLRGRAGVIIMIDGKPSPMSGADLANYLRNLPANAIERIDIITNPSSKYDAAGNSGIIDFRMKKDQRLGTNGTFTAGYGQGVYPKANAGITLNYRNKKLNIFGNYTYSYRENLNHLIINRNFYTNGILQALDDKNNYSHSGSTSNPLRLGADFFLSKNTIVGVVVNANLFNSDRKARINTISSNARRQPFSKLYSVATNDDNNKNAVTNFNFKHNFDKGRELSADVDYGVFNSSSLTRTESAYYNLDGSKKREDDILDGDQKGDLKLRTAKIDYIHPFTGGAKLEMGYKTSHVSSDNEAKFYNVFPTLRQIDDGKTNHFFYNEYNNAGYINFSKELKKFNVQAGLRGENTYLKTRQVKGNQQYSKKYFELFPSAFFNYKLKNDKTLGVSISRRIDRPGYYQLNPFLFQIDANIYATGDPLLKPQMTWSYEVSFTTRKVNMSLGYSRTKDPQSNVLSRILDVIPNFVIKPGQDSNITVQIPVNLSFSENIGLTLSSPLRINKWWNMINNLNVYYTHFNGNLAGTPLNNGSPTANIRTNNNFTFKKGWSAEWNANLFTGGRSGYMLIEPQWGMGVGLQKLIMKGNGTVRFNMSDIFWTNLPKAKVEYPGRYVENWHAYRESRVANLSFTYRFGSNTVQQARRRSSGSEEERQRIN